MKVTGLSPVTAGDGAVRGSDFKIKKRFIARNFSHIFLPGESQCHCPRRRPELRLRQQQCCPTPRARGRDLRQTGWREGARGQQQQVQHLLRLHVVR